MESPQGSFAQIKNVFGLRRTFGAASFGACRRCNRQMTRLLWLTIDNGSNVGYAKGLVLCGAEVWGSLPCSFIHAKRLPLNTSRRLQRHRAHLCCGLAQWIRQSWTQQKKKLHHYWPFFFILFWTWVVEGWLCAIIPYDRCNPRSVAATIKFIATNLETLVS